MGVTKYDIVVVGAGIVGAAAAFHLAERGQKVAVVESKSGPGQGSTKVSFSSVRAQWADPLNIELSWRSIQRWRDFEKTYGIDIGYAPNGYLLLFPEAIWEQQQEAIELQRQFGVPVDVLTVAQAKEIVPLHADGLGGATWGSADGQIDAVGATAAFLELARRRGADVFYDFAVDRIEQHGDGSWVVGAGPRTVAAGHLVNAAGGWGKEIGALAGFDIPVAHSRRNIFASQAGHATKYLPMTVDFATGAYLRTERDRVLIGGNRPGEPDGYTDEVDWEWLDGLIELGKSRFPWFADLPIDRAASWAGTYENTPDFDAILGPEPEAETWINACGLSGHGLMQAPEFGLAIAEQIVDGVITSYDLTRLGIERFRTADGPEQNISLVF